MPYHEISDPAQLHDLIDAVLSLESELDLTTVLERIVREARILSRARYGALGVVEENGTKLERFVTDGLDDTTIAKIGAPPKGAGILGLLISKPQPLRLADLGSHPDSVGFPPHHPPMKSFLGVPISVGNTIYGNLYLTDKQDQAEFSAGDERMVSALAVAAGIAIENARLHSKVQELSLAEDHARIAQDLHDVVIQQIFAVGLSLHTAIELSDSHEVRWRLTQAIVMLDETIRQLRATIFTLDSREPSSRSTRRLTEEILAICQEAHTSLGFEVKVHLEGLAEIPVDLSVATHTLTTLRESLANVARHAKATTATVTLRRSPSMLTLTVCDNGVGIPEPPPHRGRGLDNLASRAEELGGTFQVRRASSGGTEVSWRVPVSPPNGNRNSD